MIRAARLLRVHRHYPILTTTRPRTPPSTMRRPTSMTPDRSISLVMGASLPASMSDTPRRMNEWEVLDLVVGLRLRRCPARFSASHWRS
jgi:hypothetical protein